MTGKHYSDKIYFAVREHSTLEVWMWGSHTEGQKLANIPTVVTQAAVVRVSQQSSQFFILKQNINKNY